MEFKPPKRKKFAPFSDLFPFPNKAGKCFKGIFNGYNVSISDFDEMTDIYFMGNFGKGSLSKSAPNYHVAKDDMPKIILKQQWENQSKWKEEDSGYDQIGVQKKYLGYGKYQHEKARKSIDDFLQSSINNVDKGSWDDLGSNSGQNIMENNPALPENVLIDSEKEVVLDPVISSLTENILSTKKPLEINSDTSFDKESVIIVNANLNEVDVEIKKDKNLIHESLKLSLEESFFLHFALGCLVIEDCSGGELDTNQLWQIFCKTQEDFILKYVAYHYYRAKGWTVKSGIKYGGDYLLYKRGPAHYHASYLVQVLDHKKKFSWNEFVGLNRLVETFNKDLLMCYVICQKDLSEEDLSTPEILTRFSVYECISRRWIPTQERTIKN